MRETSRESCCTSSTEKLFIHLFIHSFIHSLTHSVAWSRYSLEQTVRTIFIFIFVSVSIFYFHVDFYFDLFFATFSLSLSLPLPSPLLFPCLSLSFLLFPFLFLLLLTLQLAMKTSLHWKCCARHFLSERQREIADERKESEEEGQRSCKCSTELMHFVAQSHKYFGFLPLSSFMSMLQLASSKLAHPHALATLPQIAAFSNQRSQHIQGFSTNSTSLFCANLGVYYVDATLSVCCNLPAATIYNNLPNSTQTQSSLCLPPHHHPLSLSISYRNWNT